MRWSTANNRRRAKQRAKVRAHRDYRELCAWWTAQGYPGKPTATGLSIIHWHTQAQAAFRLEAARHKAQLDAAILRVAIENEVEPFTLDRLPALLDKYRQQVAEGLGIWRAHYGL